MMKQNKKFFALLMAFAVILTMLSACGNDSASDGEKLDLSPLTADAFADYDITMINMFTSWCGPCVKELPELQKLSVEMKDKNLQVIGVLLDSVDSNGAPAEEALVKGAELLKSTGVTYPVYAPNYELFNGYMTAVFSVPDTIFVDSQGNILGSNIVGARPLDEWRSICLQKLEEYGSAK